MRKNIIRQLAIVPCKIDHEHARELSRISELLDGLGGAAARVAKDVLQGRNPSTGRNGMSGEQVLRCAIVMRLGGFSYRQLAFHIADSDTYRSFCRFGYSGKPPCHSTLQENLKRVRPETLEAINRKLMLSARDKGVEHGVKVRIDSTVVESNIHHPNDSSLLFDSVRKLTALLNRASIFATVYFSDHCKRAKRRALAISNAKSMKAREPLYRDLLKISARAVGYADDAIKALPRCRSEKAAECAAELLTVASLARRVIEQTKRRVLDGEAVPVEDKVVSIFEPHTDILVKGNRETHYGHKAFLTVGASGLVLDLVIDEGNPSDATWAVPLVERHQRLFGAAPNQASFDGGFATQANLDTLKADGVRDVAFAKKRGLQVEDMVSSPKVYEQLRRFRAGVEGVISFLKRTFGFGRCSWRGYQSFKTYAWTAALSANLLMFARHTMT